MTTPKKKASFGRFAKQNKNLVSSKFPFKGKKIKKLKN